MKSQIRSAASRAAALAAAFALGHAPAAGSIAYGSINNFDTVNDTGSECHGFEIELEDCHSTDITYTYNYNHYGVPKITEDNSVAGHPKCVIRWESAKNPDGSWAAYTAIPSGPIAATDGHQFTNPAVNFGGEHFGVGYRVPPTVVRYNWLVDSGGILVHGGAVQVSTPVFSYFPPAAAAPAQVQAVIRPPEPPEVPVKEFGPALWVKEIRTTTHNNREVKLRDLVSDDPDNPDDKNWRNGEPDEVEVEWQLLQTEFAKANGGVNGELAAAPEDLNHGDEVVTRRYEFYKYTGPFDNETGEAMAASVAADGIHGTGTKVVNGVEVDLATIEVVGAYTGAQMAAVDADAPVGLIDHLQNGEVNDPYPARTVVIQGSLPFTATAEGALPPGMSFDEFTGVLAGTPAASGEYSFKVTADDGLNPAVSKTYTFTIAAAGEILPPACLVDTTASPVAGGTTAGDGAYAPGDNVTVTANANPGYRFVSWTDNGVAVGNSPGHSFVIDVNHSLVANFVPDVPQWNIATSGAPAEGGTTGGGGTALDGSSVTVTATPNPGYLFSHWSEGGTQVSGTASYTFSASADRTLVANFTAAPSYAVTTASNPPGSGSTTGDGSYFGGTGATVTATAADGWVFHQWTVGGTRVSGAPTYAFNVTAATNLVANFVLAGSLQSIATSSNPEAGGSTSGGGNYPSGETATVVATPNPGYAFSRWQEGGVTVNTSASYTFTVAGSRTLVARFNEALVVATSSSPAAGGTTETDSLTYKTGENAKLKAFPAAGFTFANWTEDGVVVSTDATYSFNVAGNRTLVANFLSDTGITVTTNSAPAAGGTTSGDGVYPANELVVVSALASDGYAFANWTEGGVVVSSDPDYWFTAGANRALVAHFAPPVTIAAGAAPAAGGTVYGEGDYATGTEATLSAVPNPGYLFVNWTENGTPVSTAQDYTFTVNSARSLVANFSAIPSLLAAPVPAGPGEIMVSWPTSAAGWTLEESPDLDPAHWVPSARTVTASGGRSRVTIENPAGSLFFRLAHP